MILDQQDIDVFIGIDVGKSGHHAVAQAAGATVAYLAGLAMARIVDLHPGQAKSDVKDAAIITEAARSMPHTLQTIALGDETLAELGGLCGFDDDLAARITVVSNRIRGLHRPW